jgi:hypothetical protein
MAPENGKRSWQGAPHSVDSTAAEATSRFLTTQAKIGLAP